VDPNRLGDAELAAGTAKYRLVRIRRVATRGGPGGPGDQAWVWPLLSTAALVWAYVSWVSSRR
jgi:hypothetical protein